MQKIPVYYISIEGNTDHFLKVMAKVFQNVKLHRITDQSDLISIDTPFFCFIPTYVKGTQDDPNHREQQPGENFGIQEIDTLTMNDELQFHDNYQNCLGLIGSGNRNFGEDCYCWTALHYHRKYQIPIVDDFELRGTSNDENRINNEMTRIWNYHTNGRVDSSHHQIVNPRLAKLERKYNH